MTEPTAIQARELAEAVEQVLDDMGTSGQCVCLLAKAKLRIAYEPFRVFEVDGILMALDEAEKIVRECDDAR